MIQRVPRAWAEVRQEALELRDLHPRQPLRGARRQVNCGGGAWDGASCERRAVGLEHPTAHTLCLAGQEGVRWGVPPEILRGSQRNLVRCKPQPSTLGGRLWIDNNQSLPRQPLRRAKIQALIRGAARRVPVTPVHWGEAPPSGGAMSPRRPLDRQSGRLTT